MISKTVLAALVAGSFAFGLPPQHRLNSQAPVQTSPLLKRSFLKVKMINM